MLTGDAQRLKAEAVKAEAVKAEAVKAEAVKAEAVKAEAVTETKTEKKVTPDWLKVPTEIPVHQK